MNLEEELAQVFNLFFDELPDVIEIKNTSHGEEDFREAVIAKWSSGEKYVLKISDNDFTFPEKIKTWQRCAWEYRKLGYYCLFETFCPSDKTDEVLENALEWKRYVGVLPEQFHEQVERIWKRWNDNRNELEKIYRKLPTSVFQADLNTTNLLLDESGEFVGVFDFNLCGRDVFLNNLFREIHYQYELQYLLDTLRNVSQVYCFSELEKQAAPLLYRCLLPLWFTEIETLKEVGQDGSKIQECLNRTEELQTKEIPFAEYMSA